MFSTMYAGELYEGYSDRGMCTVADHMCMKTCGVGLSISVYQRTVQTTNLQFDPSAQRILKFFDTVAFRPSIAENVAGIYALFPANRMRI